MGQRDDPFFVDLGATFDAINVREGTGNEGEGKDDLSGLLDLVHRAPDPRGLVTRNGKPVVGPERQQRGGRRLVDHRAAPAPGDERRLGAGSPWQGHGTGTGAFRSRGWATRWSTRW